MEFFVNLLVAVASLAGLYKIFEKAGETPWTAIIPIFNIWVASKVCRRPWWLILLLLIPFVGAIVVYGILSYDLARSFNKPPVYALGVFFLPFIFLPMLGFGPDKFTPLALDRGLG